MAEATVRNLPDLPDAELRRLLPRQYDFSKDEKLNKGLRRMRWINHIRHHRPEYAVVVPKQKPEVPEPPPVKQEKKLPKNYYFDNDRVEDLLIRYQATACTDVALRNEIMSHVNELIRQIIRAHGLGNIYPGKEDSSHGDLFQTAWVQVESVLYKFQPGKAKIFNMFSQIARTVILAYIKKEGRDRKNSGSYREFIVKKETTTNTHSMVFERFLHEAQELCKYNDEHLKVLQAMERLYDSDPRPYEGLTAKLTQESGLPKQRVVNFLMMLRLRAHEFSDAPIHDRPKMNPLTPGGGREEDE